ncbi:MAG: hypothetical protein NC177_02735 [Ruminococcus flavefaciens]|nr:hypothetical protein [Ruminococcus flavefaciens]
MSTPIKTNQLVYKISYDKLDGKYDIFCIQTSEKHFKSGAYIVDAPALNKNVCSVQFESGNKFYVMMNKNSDNKRLLHETLSGAKGAEFITLRCVESSELYNDRIILQLLFNSLGSVSHPLLRFNNITGHLYCFHNDWLVRRKDNIVQIICLEIGVSPDYRLKFDVRTFTSERLENCIKFGKKKFKDYPQYVLSENNTLRRKLETDLDKAFILRQISGEKSHINFMDFRKLETFEKSKMGVLSSVMMKFNEKFSDIAEVGFQNIDNYISVECEKHDRKADIKFIKKIIQSQKIYIVDKINDEDSQKLCEQLQDILLKEYTIKAEIRKRIVKNSMNLCLIHNAEYYENIEKDDLHKQYYDAIVQHITLEDFELFNKNGKPSADVAQAIHELLIKTDLLNDKITLFDWTGMGFDHKISFGIKAEKDEQTHYFFMTISPDGSFDITEQEFTLFEQNEYNQCIDIFEIAKQNSETIKGIIRDEYGNINIIKDTEWVTIPEIFKIRSELENGNTALKNEEARNELLPSVIDIKQFRYDNSIYYFAGVVGKSMDDMKTAVNIRRIDVYEDSEELFEKLLPLMDVGFVHNRQLTVIPFPFKYIREHIKKLGFDIL